MSSFRVGTSGWQYDDWPGRFYPRDLPRSRWFSYYAAHFDTVEVNATFYRLPEPARFDVWRAQAPPGFVYALKFSRYGSHLKKLKDPEATVGAFVERARRLGDRLGPILVQLPPRWQVDPDRLVGFLEVAPADLSWVLEFRDPSWLCDEIYEVLTAFSAAICIHDLIDDHPRVATSDLVYYRFHGESYAGRYPPQVLAARAREVRTHLDAGRSVWAFFNNDIGAAAVEDARALRRDVAGPQHAQ